MGPGPRRVTERRTGWPRLHPPRVEDSGMRIGHLDPDVTLLHLVQNP